MSDFWIEKKRLIKYEGKGRGKIEIPAGVEEILPSAFENAKISEVKLPSSVKIIGSAAFKNCDNLSYIELPCALSLIGTEAFANCENLTEVRFYDGQDESQKLIIDEKAFYMCPSLVKIDFPESLYSIGEYAFYGCKMGHVFITDKCANIKNSAFANCTRLQTLVVPRETILGEYVLSGHPRATIREY